MKRLVLIAHAEGEEAKAEMLAAPLREAGYEVWHRGEVLVGESITEEASKILNTGAPVVLCGTVSAMGTGWAHLFVNAARSNHHNVRVFPVKMEEKAYIDILALDATVANYWQDPAKAIENLLISLRKYYPLQDEISHQGKLQEAELIYRSILQETCDIIDLTNLPDDERHSATRKLDLRKLYVPLRVQRDAPSSKEINDGEPETLEKPREELVKVRTQWSRTLIDGQKNKGNRVPIGHKLADSRFLIVLGDPGAGKTTVLRWLATAYLLRNKPEWQELPDVSTLPDEDLLPIFVRCRDFGEGQFPASLEDLLYHTLYRAQITVAAASILRDGLREKLKQGKALLLIDGLDEILDPIVRARFCEQLEKIRIAYSESSIIVTSRIAGYREMGNRLRGFEHLRVSDLLKEDKDDFARRWCTLTISLERRAAEIKELIHDIHSTDRIEQLTSNPMLLTTMALVKRKVGRLPTRRVDLYGDALDVLLNWRRVVDKPIDWHEAVPQLEYLAYTMCDRGILQVRKDEVLRIFDRVREEYPTIRAIQAHTPEEFLSLLELRTGILIQAGTVRHLGLTTPLYEFRHLTFQEYLAARALVDGKYPGRDRRQSVAEKLAVLAGQTSEEKNPKSGMTEIAVAENWREALRLCVAACRDDDVDSALLAILNPLDNEDDTVTQRARAVLTALCLADEPNVSEEVAQRVIQVFTSHIGDAASKGMVSSSVDVAVNELSSSFWGPALQRALVKEFCQRNPRSRRSIGTLTERVCSATLPNKGEVSQEFIDQLANKIESGEVIESVEGAIKAAAITLGFAAVVPKLIGGLFQMLERDGPSAHAAAYALKRFCKIKSVMDPWVPSGEEIERCIGLVRKPSFDEGAKWNLIAVLGETYDKRAIPLMIEIVEGGSQWERSVAAEALGKIGDSAALEHLLRLLHDESAEVRKSSAGALGLIGNKRALTPLINLLSDGKTIVRRAAALALGDIGDARAVDPLLASLEPHQKSNIRRASITALGSIAAAAKVETLPDVIDDDKGEQHVLSKYQYERIVSALISMLNNEDSSIRKEAVTSLGRLQDVRVIQQLINKLNDDSISVQSAAAQALQKKPEEAAITPLLRLLRSDSLLLRLRASAALRSIDSNEKIQPLLAIIRDDDKDSRTAAIMALAGVKDARIIEPLLSCFDDEDEEVRESVALALGRTKDKRVIGHLLNKTSDPSFTVRRMVSFALSYFEDSSEVIEPLIQRLNDEHYKVRQAAALSLGNFKDDRLVRALMGRLSDESVSVRLAAIASLGNVGSSLAVESLLGMIEIGNYLERDQSIIALDKIDVDCGEEQLVASLRDTNEQVVESADSALNSLALRKYSVRDIDGAIRIFGAIDEVSPSDTIKNNMAFCAMLLGRYGSAAEKIEQIDFLNITELHPLYQNNRGLLAFLMGEAVKAKEYLMEGLRWISELGGEYDPREVHSVLLIKNKDSVMAKTGVPVDVAILINLYSIGGLSREGVFEQLSARYPSEAEEWSQLLKLLNKEGRDSYIN